MVGQREGLAKLIFLDEPVDKGFERDDFGQGFLFTYPRSEPHFLLVKILLLNSIVPFFPSRS